MQGIKLSVLAPVNAELDSVRMACWPAVGAYACDREPEEEKETISTPVDSAV
jgi:hypothetical protein